MWIAVRTQYDNLPEVFQNKIEDQRIKRRTLYHSDLHDILVSIERKEQHDLLEEKAKKRKSAEWTKNTGGQGGFSVNKKTKRLQLSKVALLEVQLTISKELRVR
jgi:hypothetical protein